MTVELAVLPEPELLPLLAENEQYFFPMPSDWINVSLN